MPSPTLWSVVLPGLIALQRATRFQRGSEFSKQKSTNINMSEQTEMDTTPGIFSWNELMTRDADSSAKFYTALFGWTREDMDMGGFTYSMFRRASGGRDDCAASRGRIHAHDVDGLRDGREPRSVGGKGRRTGCGSPQGDHCYSDGALCHHSRSPRRRHWTLAVCDLTAVAGKWVRPAEKLVEAFDRAPAGFPDAERRQTDPE
jgi:hypothetical protein